MIGVGALALIVSAGLFGNQNTFKNIAPVAVWVIWWVGFELRLRLRRQRLGG